MPMNPKAVHSPETGKLEQTPESAQIDADACELRSRGWAYREIAEELGLSTPAQAHLRVQRAMTRVIQEPAEQARQFELDRLDRMYRNVEEVLAGHHVVVQHGKVVYDHDGEPLTDHDPRMRAVATLLKIQERRSKLLGLDSAQKVQLDGGVRYELVGVDMDKLT
jgi:hypothetical protein